MTEDELNDIVNRIIQRLITDGIELTFFSKDDDNIEFLEQELSESILNEEYEKASVIQDMINKLKNK